jgi:hypothetical protein
MASCVASPWANWIDLVPVIDEGDEMVAVRVLAPTVPVKVRLLKVASPEVAVTEFVPVSTAPLEVITTDWFASEPVVTRLPSAS